MNVTSINTEINLARKWRPKNFTQIVGQDISIRILKNSLYLKKFFPVYLFAGQRGCGKTSTARVFGAAINCAQLSNFQQDPTTIIPCMECQSCTAMINTHHPDFIEIDAASHTGVDNVRQIIEAAAYMPLLGSKKIYLIDEAHMLSKAAFNALLKILEEPPMTVVFILATTELQKIPSTVLSRCFQISFTPLETTQLKNYLTHLSQQENIPIDESAIDLIIAETEGSVRDAINLLERVRFSGTQITEDTILKILGKLSNQTLLTLAHIIIEQNSKKLLTFLKTISFETIAPTILWDMLVSLTRSMLWVKYGIFELPVHWAKNTQDITTLAEKCSLNRLQAIMQLLWTQEEIFIKTNKKHAFLEMVLLQLCEQINTPDLESLINAVNNQTTSLIESNPHKSLSYEANYTPSKEPIIQENKKPATQQEQPWLNFLEKIATLQDPLLHSIFLQAVFLGWNDAHTQIKLQLSNNSKFFKDKIEECKSLWVPPLQLLFSDCHDFEFAEIGSTPQPPKKIEPIQTLTPITPPKRPASSPPQPAPYKRFTNQGRGPLGQEKMHALAHLEAINVDDKEKWPLANLILSHFPGKIRKVKD